MNLTNRQLRVLGCLIEKEMTTPEYYPMTLNGIRAACNQKSNRSPVVDYDDEAVVGALDGLRDLGLARTVHGKGDRALKYRHVLHEVLGVAPPQAALLAVLMLRGPQTLGEVRTRTGRYWAFPDLSSVAEELLTMSEVEEPLVVRLPRRPGEKEARYRHLLGSPDDSIETVEDGPEWRHRGEAAVEPAVEGAGDIGALAGLEAGLADLRRRIEVVERELGLTADEPSDEAGALP